MSQAIDSSENRRGHGVRIIVRAADDTEIDQLAQLWYDGWQDAHAAIVPAELKRLRTLESFRSRIQEALAEVRVVGSPGDPVGLCIVRVDELYQLYEKTLTP